MSARTKDVAAASPTTAAAGRPPTSPGAGPQETAARRRRTGLKRTAFQVPAMPVPVRALWAQASEEQRAVAHRTAVAVLKTWLGKARREEAAKDLGLTGVRFWQLSQQALAGLVAGCLRQPRYRGRGAGAGEEGVGPLRKRIAHLERELGGAQRLIGLLKELPGRREPCSVERNHGRARGRRRGPAQAGDDGGAAARDGGDAVGPESR